MILIAVYSFLFWVRNPPKLECKSEIGALVVDKRAVLEIHLN